MQLICKGKGEKEYILNEKKRFKTSSPALEYMPEERRKIQNDPSIHYRGRMCCVNDFYVTQSDGYLHVKAKYLNIDVHQRLSLITFHMLKYLHSKKSCPLRPKSETLCQKGTLAKVFMSLCPCDCEITVSPHFSCFVCIATMVSPII